MKIVHVITRFICGGADENTLISCNWSARNGDSVTLIHGAVFDERMVAKLDPSVRRLQVKHMVRDISLIHDVLAYRQMVEILRELKPDIVHTHTSKAGIIGRAAAHAAGVPGIVHGIHIVPFMNTGPVERVLYLTAERIVARWTDAYISVSKGMRDAFLGQGLGTPDVHHVVYSGMNIDEFRNPEPIRNWHDLLGLGGSDVEKPPIVLMVAAFEPRKRQTELIAAFDRLWDEVPDAVLVLAGDGDRRNAIEAARAASRKPQNIRLLGHHNNPGGLLKLADVCVHCATHEGLPRVVVQSLAAGVPVVMLALPGIEELLRSGTNGLLIGEHDFAALATALVKVLTDGRLIREMAQGAAATDVSAWDSSQMCSRNQSVYDAVLAGVR